MSKIVEFNLKDHESRELSLEAFLRDGPREDLAYWADLNGSSAEELAAVAKPLAIPERVLRRWQNPDSSRQITEDANSIALMLEYWNPGAVDAEESPRASSAPPGEASAAQSTAKVSLFLSDRFFVSYSPERVRCLSKVDRVYAR